MQICRFQITWFTFKLLIRLYGEETRNNILLICLCIPLHHKILLIRVLYQRIHQLRRLNNLQANRIKINKSSNLNKKKFKIKIFGKIHLNMFHNIQTQNKLLFQK